MDSNEKQLRHPSVNRELLAHCEVAGAEMKTAFTLALPIADLWHRGCEELAYPSFGEVWKVAEAILARADYADQGGDDESLPISLDALINH